MKNGDKPIANPHVILREEFDDWAVLFNSDTGRGFGLSPTGVYVWKLLDGEHSIDDMAEALRRDALDVPQEAGDHIVAFVEELARHCLAGYEAESVHETRGCIPPCPPCASEIRFTYEPPRLINLSGEAPAKGYCCSSGTYATGDGCGCTGQCVDLSGYCSPGACANFYCVTGLTAYTGCRTGCDGYPNGAICTSGSCAGNDKCSCSAGW